MQRWIAKSRVNLKMRINGRTYSKIEHGCGGTRGPRGGHVARGDGRTEASPHYVESSRRAHLARARALQAFFPSYASFPLPLLALYRHSQLRIGHTRICWNQIGLYIVTTSQVLLLVRNQNKTTANYCILTSVKPSDGAASVGTVRMLLARACWSSCAMKPFGWALDSGVWP